MPLPLTPPGLPPRPAAAVDRCRPAAHRATGWPARCAQAAAVLLALATAAGHGAPPPAPGPAPAAPAAPTAAQVLQAASASDWRPLDAAHTLRMDLANGPVLIELAPRFAPRHVANILALARGRYFDGLAVLRVQDNFVAQWGDPNGEQPDQARPLGRAETHLPAEFDVALAGLPFTRQADADGWAPAIGWVDGFPVAADPARGRAWLAHCYGMVGAGRNDAPDSSNGSELYAVIGHAPRGLDLNITLVGRVVSGIERLSALPRGGGAMGFYEQPTQRMAIQRVRVLDELPPHERLALQVLRTDTPTWQALLQARRQRREPWFVHSAGHVGLCSATVPTRAAPAPAAAAASAAAG